MGNHRNLTIKDIAEKLNLSKSTVSRAMRDSYDVNPQTRARVLSLIKELNFEANVNARGLREQKTFNIGVVIPSFQIPFYSVAVGGIHKVLSEAGYNVMTSQTNETYESELISVNSFLKNRVDGMLISFSANTNQFSHIREVAEKGVPVVMFNRITTDADLPSVTVDDYKGAYNAIEYLISRGGRNIGYIAGPANPLLSKRRKQGFIDCLKAHGMLIREDWIIESDFSVAGGMRAAEAMLRYAELPDSLFCICDSVAVGAMITLKKKGVRIPDDISVIGFTNDFFSGLVDPPLTTISQPVSEIGEKAAELLLLQLKRKLTKWDTRQVVLDTSLVIRESTR